MKCPQELSFTKLEVVCYSVVRNHVTAHHGNVAWIVVCLSQAGGATSSSVNKAGRNAVVTSMMVCCGFVACWTLNEIFFFVNTIHHVIDFSGWLYHLSVVLVFANSCINPFIYAAKYRDFQTAVKRMIDKQVHPQGTSGGTS